MNHLLNVLLDEKPQERVAAMMVVKKINNNVAICRDGSQRELVAFGKGIGFPPAPYELTDLSRIDRTFYNVNSQYIPLLADIPPELVRFTADQMLACQDDLPYETSSNLVRTLADHIAFAVERAGRGIYVQMPSIYEMEMNYPAEVKVGRKMVAALRRQLKIRLPKGEVQGIAMHLINARDKALDGTILGLEEQCDDILDRLIAIIEDELGVHVRRDTFNFARFATHVQYLLKRIFEHKHIDSENLRMYQSLREEYPGMSACVDKIARNLNDGWSIELTEDEKLYLILHVNRVCSKENSDN